MITFSSGLERSRNRLGKASASRTARTPALKPQAKLPRTAADWTIMLLKLTSESANWESASAAEEERIKATDGMAQSSRKESFLSSAEVHGPMIGTVAAAVGMVVSGSGSGRIGMA
ncbi:hypothetical protein OIU74_001564 [Salix koriyanagi]|uniref:Uncharacterized protein n=1 Tax=Salix koriyanagi TaxID=2511006 RepID=A0A9Q0X2J2_9ROSI|nr:hypothetical protein OIU74_001564 [Salix koriyanagi]